MGFENPALFKVGNDQKVWESLLKMEFFHVNIIKKGKKIEIDRKKKLNISDTQDW